MFTIIHGTNLGVGTWDMVGIAGDTISLAGTALGVTIIGDGTQDLAIMV
jgi:hypothetical protein